MGGIRRCWKAGALPYIKAKAEDYASGFCPEMCSWYTVSRIYRGKSVPLGSPVTDVSPPPLQAAVSDLNLNSSLQQRFYEIAGITVKVESDIPMTDETFAPKFKPFRADRAGQDVVTLRHHFGLANWQGHPPGREVYNKPPWIVYRNPSSLTYALFPQNGGTPLPIQIATLNNDCTETVVYSGPQSEQMFRRGSFYSLTGLPTDQIFLVPALADRQGCFLHAAGAILNGKGLVFAGQSGAGKSTMVKMLRSRSEILSDDRIVMRRDRNGFRVYGTWDHGEVPLVSPSNAPLHAIFFLQQSKENRIVPLVDPQIILSKLLARLVKPTAIKNWWDKILPLIEFMVREIPCYDLQFDLSGQVVQLLEGFCR